MSSRAENCGGCKPRSSLRTRHSTCRRWRHRQRCAARPPPRRRFVRGDRRYARSWCSPARGLRDPPRCARRACRGSTRRPSALIDGGTAGSRAVPGRPWRQARSSSAAGSVWVANTLDGTVTRIDRRRQVVTIPVGGAPAGADVRRRVAVGRRRRRPPRRAGRSRDEQGRAADRCRERAAGCRHRRQRAVDRLGRRRAVHRIALGRTFRAGRSHRRQPECHRRRRRRGLGRERRGRDGHARSTRARARSCAHRRRQRTERRRVGRGCRVGRQPRRRNARADRSGDEHRVMDGPSGATRLPSRPVGGRVGRRGRGAHALARGPIGAAHLGHDPQREQPLRDRVAGGGDVDGRRSRRRPATEAARCGALPRQPGRTPSRSTGCTRSARAGDDADPSLAYDGLVGYRRVAGSAGGTLVGALATDAPPPSRDGRTYRFTLRRGLRYSDGTPVRPAGLPRVDRALAAASSVTRSRRIYRGIVGAERCVAQPWRCDLSAGIVTDAAGADDHDPPDPPRQRLPAQAHEPVGLCRARGFAGPAAGGGRRPVRGRTASRPGTRGRGGRAGPKPVFPASPAPEARPAGFADRIEIAVRPRCRHGGADRARCTTARTISPSRRARSAPHVDRGGARTDGRSPGQLHGVPAGVTD